MILVDDAIVIVVAAPALVVAVVLLLLPVRLVQDSAMALNLCVREELQLEN